MVGKYSEKYDNKIKINPKLNVIVIIIFPLNKSSFNY